MVSPNPKQLDFSSSDGVGDSEFVILSRRKSPRTPSSKRTAPPEVPEAEEETKKKRQRTDKKKKKKKKNKKETKTKFTRIWNEVDELTLLKGFVDYKVMTGLQTKTDWVGFYRFLGSSIGGSVVAKYSKDQVHGKIRKLRSKYLHQMEKINQANDPNFTDSEIFGYSEIVWGHEEAAMNKEQEEQAHAEPLNDNEAVTVNATARQAQLGADDEQLNDNEAVAENVTARQAQLSADDEQLNDNEAVAENVTARQAELSADDEPLNENEAVAENATARQVQQNENGEEMMKEHDEEADVERLNDNRAAKITETDDGKEGQGDNDEIFVVQDAFETLMSQGLSDYQKKVQLEKLLHIGIDKMRELSNDWKALCVEERSLNLKKLRFSTKLGEAVFR